MRSLLLTLLCLAPACVLAQAPPTNATVPTTKILAIGHVVAANTPDSPEARRAIMPNEVHDTVDLYLAGKIDQWFVRQDGKGVVFLINASSSDEAAKILSNLPLVRAKRLEFDLMPLGPLSPLRYLLGDPASAPKP